MKLPDEVRSLLQRRYAGKHRAWLAGAEDGAAWPLKIALGVPSEQEALRQPGVVRAWAGAWHDWRGNGTVEWTERRWRVLGTQRLPKCLVLHNADQVCGWIGETARWSRAGLRHGALVQRWPQLAAHLPGFFDVLADYSEADMARLADVLAWLEANPDSGLYPRQLPVAGMDTKWLEPRQKLIGNLFAALRGSDHGDSDFHAICGLRPRPVTARMRFLDPALRAQLRGLGDVTAPVADLANLGLAPRALVIVENLQSGLALPDLPGTVALMGLGYAVDVVSQIPWLRGVPGIYWGDIDTHGFIMLHRARAHLPQLASVLMDEATMRHFAALWTEEASPCTAQALDLLTPAEAAVFAALRDNAWGHQLRLEQERIPWPYAVQALKNALSSIWSDTSLLRELDHATGLDPI